MCDALKIGGFDLNGRMKAEGGNPHYCPSMMAFFRKEQTFIAGKTGAQVGDAVFFSWDGGPDPDHVAVVTAVDADGKPTRIAESYDFNLAAHEVELGDKASCLLGFGRIDAA